MKAKNKRRFSLTVRSEDQKPSELRKVCEPPLCRFGPSILHKRHHWKDDCKVSTKEEKIQNGKNNHDRKIHSRPSKSTCEQLKKQTGFSMKKETKGKDPR